MTAIRYPQLRAAPGQGCLSAGVLVILLLAAPDLSAAELQSKTLLGWQKYLRLTEERVERELGRDRWEDPEQAGGGNIQLVRMQTLDNSGRPVTVDGGMIHHWKGSVFIPGVTLEEVLKFVQNYGQHYRFFREVEQSRLISRQGETFRIFYRLRYKKFTVTTVYNTEHTVVHRRHGPRRASSRSVASRIAELEAPGTPAEKEKPVGQGRGFLWRVNGYWRFAERPGAGVVVQWESVSLSRRIPLGLAWLVKRFVESVPRESLVSTLSSIRETLKK